MADYLFSIRRDGTAQLDSYEGKDSQIVIPDHYEGKPVTVIADNAFSWLSGIQSVVIPETVVTLGEAAFSWCESLVTVSIPQTVKTIGEWCFIGCSSLKSVSVPPLVRKINYSTFQSCSSLSTVYLPDSLHLIGPEAFAECRSLRFITLPKNLAELGENAFASCDALTSINIPSHLQKIGSGAFSGCVALSSITVAPDHPIFMSDDNVLINRKDKRLIFYPFEKHDHDYIVPDTVAVIDEEAFAKALGTGFIEGIFLRDIQILHNALGKPMLKISGAAVEHLHRLCVAPNLYISLSDDYPYAMATVIIEK